MKNIANYRQLFYNSYNEHQDRRFSNAAGAEGKRLAERAYELDIGPFLPSDKETAILDVGCGAGGLVAYLNKLGYQHVLGIDTSADQVAEARKRGLQTVAQADVFEYLVPRKNAFDLITGLDIIEHFTKDEICHLLGMVRASLKTNGRVLFRTPNADTLFPGVYANGDFTHECILNMSSGTQLMRVCGFGAVVVKPAAVVSGGGLKGCCQKMLWPLVRLNAKVVLFASGRSTRGLCLSPNLIIVGNK